MQDIDSDTRYTETVQAHPILGVLFIGIIGLLVYISVKVPGEMPQRLLVFIILLLVFVYSNFMKLQINITSTRLTVAFGIIKYGVNIRDIEQVETYKPPMYWYGGFGIRFGWDGSIGFIQNYRTGVKVYPCNGRKLVFSTNQPQQIVEIINNLREKSGYC